MTEYKIRVLSLSNTWVCVGDLSYFLLFSNVNYMIASTLTAMGWTIFIGVGGLLGRLLLSCLLLVSPEGELSVNLCWALFFFRQRWRYFGLVELVQPEYMNQFMVLT